MSHVFISNKQLAKNIGVSSSHASVIMDQLEDIFKLDISKNRGRGEARQVKLSKTFIDFMKVFTDIQLEEFIMNHNIDPIYHFAVKQIYRYLGWGIAPGQLTPSEKKERKEYMSDKERKNFLHYAFTSHHKVETRIKYLEEHKDKLNDLEKRQLHSIKESHVPGTKLAHYWFKVLISIQQRISYLVDQVINKSKKDESQNTSANSENNNQEKSVAHASATQEQQKLPEDPEDENNFSLQFMGKAITSWNKRADRCELPMVQVLTENRYNSILALKEEYSERDILNAISNLEYVHKGDEYDTKYTFERFIQSEGIRYALEYNSNSDKAVTVDFFTDLTNSANVNKFVLAVPEFKSRKELNTWLKQQN